MTTEPTEPCVQISSEPTPIMIIPITTIAQMTEEEFEDYFAYRSAYWRNS